MIENSKHPSRFGGESASSGACIALRGELLRPGDAGYEQARRVYNGMIDKHPR